MTDRFGYNIEWNNPRDLSANLLVKQQLEKVLLAFETFYGNRKLKVDYGIDLKDPRDRHQIYNHLSVIGQLCKCLWARRDFSKKGRLGWSSASSDYRLLRDWLQHNPYRCFYEKDTTIIATHTTKSVSDFVIELSDLNKIRDLRDQLQYILI